MTPGNQGDLMASFPMIHAHRGASRQAPENTLSAFEAAINLGADAIEFDLHWTIDRAIVVHHDCYLGRTNDGEGLIAGRTVEELKKLDAGSWFSSDFVDEKIPTLAEVLDLGGGKCSFEMQLAAIPLQFISSVLRIVGEHGLGEDVEITSTFTHVLGRVRSLDPDIRTGVILPAGEKWMKEDLWQLHSEQTMQLLDAQVAHLPLSRLTPQILQVLQGQGYLVHAADCDTPGDIERAFKAGVDQFSTTCVKEATDFKQGLSQVSG
jgi:glycerophosphoryl diester phosphodiesterase